MVWEFPIASRQKSRLSDPIARVDKELCRVHLGLGALRARCGEKPWEFSHPKTRVKMSDSQRFIYIYT